MGSGIVEYSCLYTASSQQDAERLFKPFVDVTDDLAKRKVMYSLSAIDAHDESAGNYDKLKDLAWTGLPTPIANYTNSGKTVYNITYNYDMYQGYFAAIAQQATLPEAITSEFG